MFTDLLILTAAMGLVFIISVSLLIWDNQRFFRRELAKVETEEQKSRR
jgi:hypothetical protein